MLKSLISRSGLLDTIDGDTSQKGRVLILTTNHLEILDTAPIRPGHVDSKMQPTLTTRSQTHDIFMHMYTSGHDPYFSSTLSKPSERTESKRAHKKSRLSSRREDKNFLELPSHRPVSDKVNSETLEATRDKFSPVELSWFLSI